MKKPTTQGYTLVEMLVYIAIFVVVTSVAGYLLFTLNGIVNQYRVTTALYRSGTAVMEQVLTGIRQADGLVSADSVFNTSSTGALAVSRGTAITTYRKVGDDIALSISGVDYGTLLAPEVQATGFTVYQYPTTVGTLVRVKVELEATIGSTTRATTLYGGGVIRGEL